jgi:DGQHR domain-containing protein
MIELRFPALEVRQGPERVLYSFAVDGKVLSSFTTITRVRRSQNGDIAGYQRGEVLSHVAEIRRYLEGVDPLLPNALVVAFDSRVRFEPHGDSNGGGEYSRSGTLVIPHDPAEHSESRPGWIVDGQQRAAAIREARIDSFPVCVTSFVARDLKEQREQFILVNATKPLPKGLIYELLPQTEGHLPSLLERRRFPALLVDRLNRDDDSPFQGLVNLPTNPEGLVKDNSLMRMIENSLTDGVLYRFRSEYGTRMDPKPFLSVLNNFWRAVAATFPQAWGCPPRHSRLMHGVGIVSLGYVMDAIADRHRQNEEVSEEVFATELKPLGEICRWTEGFWDLGIGLRRKWNELQNTSKDIQLLTNILLIHYKASNRVLTLTENA